MHPDLIMPPSCDYHFGSSIYLHFHSSDVLMGNEFLSKMEG